MAHHAESEQPTATDEPVVSHNRDRGRFEIAVDGQRAGVAMYAEVGGRRTFFHTEVDDAYSGRGLAAVLVRQALDATRADGLEVVAVCPYVAAFVKRHHDWDDIIEPASRTDLEAVRAATL
jgi:predicted GNAT family acetyltransferase